MGTLKRRLPKPAIAALWRARCVARHQQLVQHLARLASVMMVPTGKGQRRFARPRQTCPSPCRFHHGPLRSGARSEKSIKVFRLGSATPRRIAAAPAVTAIRGRRILYFSCRNDARRCRRRPATISMVASSTNFMVGRVSKNAAHAARPATHTPADPENSKAPTGGFGVIQQPEAAGLILTVCCSKHLWFQGYMAIDQSRTKCGRDQCRRCCRVEFTTLAHDDRACADQLTTEPAFTPAFLAWNHVRCA